MYPTGFQLFEVHNGGGRAGQIWPILYTPIFVVTDYYIRLDFGNTVYDLASTKEEIETQKKRRNLL